MKGTIARLVTAKGFGFVRGEDNIEYFFHRSGVSGRFDDLRENQDVTFEPEKSDKGPRAKDVTMSS